MHAAAMTTLGVLCCLAVGRGIDARSVRDSTGDGRVDRVFAYQRHSQ